MTHEREEPEDAVDLAGGFGFEDDRWFCLLREGRERSFGALGSYDVVAEVGRGGQGVVYRGRQRGTGREVALKRLVAGAFATDEARKRFEREIETVSTLRHPGVVSVYGLETVGREPVLAMEWIEGVPITRWAAANGGRGVEAIAGVFLQVCDAVAHAHRHGVIHRDLKPSNILVDQEDRARVLDFGMAKVATGGGPDDPPLTGSSVFAGTIAYASPEQVAAGASAVDTRTDVYSLGVILYELLTRRPLLPADATLDQLVQAILRDDPPPPSSREPRVPRELDHVVMAAIAKEKDRRYGSVDELAADIRRFLRGEALHAHPPSRWYRLKKLVTRHRLASGLAAIILVLAVALVVTTLLQTSRLKSERDAALLAGQREAKARAIAQYQRESTEATLQFLLEDLIGAVNPETGGRDVTVAAAVDHARALAGKRFVGRPALEAAVRRSIGDVYRKLARYEDAEAEHRKSLALWRADPHQPPASIANALISLARTLVQQGKQDEARALFAEARSLLQQSRGADDAVLATILDHLAVLEVERGDFARAAELGREGLEIWQRLEGADSLDVAQARQNLSVSLMYLGKVEEARVELAEALRILEKHGKADAEAADSLLTNLGWAEVLLGRLDEGIASLRRATTICESRYGEHPETARTLAVLAQALTRAGNLTAAEHAATRALRIHRAASPAPRRDLAITIAALARIRGGRGDRREAADLMAETVEMFRTLGNAADAAKAASELEALRQPAESRPASR